MKELGTNSYRFSISWARIYPTGRKADGLNQKGLDWYKHFATRLIEEGIRPLVTLYHWDLPNDLETSKGKENNLIFDFSFGFRLFSTNLLH